MYGFLICLFIILFPIWFIWSFMQDAKKLFKPPMHPGVDLALKAIAIAYHRQQINNTYEQEKAERKRIAMAYSAARAEIAKM